MSELDVQLFREDGTWVKPAGAVTVDVVLAGGDASNRRWPSAFEVELDAGKGTLRADTGGAEVSARTFDAGDLPDEVAVAVGLAGRGTGGSGSSHGILTFSHSGGGPGGSSVPPRDGLAVIITHLAS